MKSFLIKRYIPWHLFKEILISEFSYKVDNSGKMPKPIIYESNDSRASTNLKILLDWFEEKKLNISGDFIIPHFDEVNKFILHYRVYLIPRRESLLQILNQYSNVYRVVDARIILKLD